MLLGKPRGVVAIFNIVKVKNFMFKFGTDRIRIKIFIILV